MTSKICTKCGADKPFSEYRKSGVKDKLMGACKICCRVADKAKYAANPAKERARCEAWRQANMEKVRARQLARRESNAEKINAQSAAWYAINKHRLDPAKRRAASLKWFRANKEKANAISAAWLAANPDTSRIRNQNRRARKLASSGKLSKGLDQKLFKLQKGKCACCKRPLGDNYHLDHIMPLALGGAHVDSNIQLLRQRCNNEKHAKHPVDFMQERGFLL